MQSLTLQEHHAVTEAPQYDFGRGYVFRELSPTSFQVLTAAGAHVTYLRAEAVEYEPTLAAQYVRTRLAGAVLHQGKPEGHE